MCFAAPWRRVGCQAHNLHSRPSARGAAGRPHGRQANSDVRRPNFSPRSRRGRRLRRLLRIHDDHYARVWADREASGVAAAVDERRRIEEDLQAAARGAFDQGGHSVADVALQAAALLAVKLGSYHDFKRAPAVILALLEIAGGPGESTRR
jgi:hypothetical protein